MKDNNDKNIYDMLNDIDVDLDEFDIEEFDDIEKMKIKKKFRESIGKSKRTNNYKKYVSVASVAVVSLGIISLTPVGTYASKIISDLVFDIKSAMRLDVDKDNYINVINKSITKDTITLRLNEAILNNDELIISLSTISEKNIPRDINIWRPKGANLYINGEMIDGNQLSSGGTASKTNFDEVIFFKVNSQYTGTINVKLELGDIEILRETKNHELINEHTIKGPFVFEFDLDTTKINKNIKEVNLNETIELEEGSYITMDKYVYTPLSQKIYYTENQEAFEKDKDIILRGKDDLGNNVEFDRYTEVNGEGQFIVRDGESKVSKDAKYLILKAYERQWVKDNRNKWEIKYKEASKEIKVDLTN